MARDALHGRYDRRRDMRRAGARRVRPARRVRRRRGGLRDRGRGMRERADHARAAGHPPRPGFRWWLADLAVDGAGWLVLRRPVANPGPGGVVGHLGRRRPGRPAGRRRLRRDRLVARRVLGFGSADYPVRLGVVADDPGLGAHGGGSGVAVSSSGIARARGGRGRRLRPGRRLGARARPARID